MKRILEKYRRIELWKKWSSKLKRVIKEEEVGKGTGGRKGINLAIVSANNHYAGLDEKLLIYLER
jgi:hypothetical protein